MVSVGKHILLLSAFADEAVPNQAGEALASTMGLEWVRVSGSPVAPRFVPPLPVKQAPVMGNVTVAGNPVTAATVMIQPATHSMLDRRMGRQTVEPAFPPFVPLPMPVTIENPIVELQTMLGDFAASFLAGQPPTVSNPF